MSETGEALRRVFIRTYGCQMNVYDSERTMDALADAGYRAAPDPESADLILINTCHIREKAAEKVYSELGRLRRLKEAAAAEGRAVTLGVTGCLAQAEGEEIVVRQPAVDLVVGPQAYHRLPEMLRALAPGRPLIETGLEAAKKFRHLDATPRAPDAAVRAAAFLTVQEGCDKFCSFCVVPYTRGAEVSRPLARIVAEAERLAAAGVRELTLLGQNVNAWRADGPDGRPWGLGRLLFRLAGISGIARLRYTTSHPRDMSDDLIAAHRDLAVLMPYLHLPVQSGSDRILAAMNRRHTRHDYIRLVERIRAARPDLALAGDFIVGFPGETDADFADTLSMVTDSDTVAAFTFKYSQRPGTPAATAAGQVDEAVKNERLYRLQTLIDRRQAAFMAGMVGTVVDLLFERPGRRPGQIVGRSPWLMPVHVEAPQSLLGSLARARLTGVAGNSFFAELIAPPFAAGAGLEAVA